MEQSSQPLFDAYIMLDWSASNVPTSGADSIWIGCFERRAGKLLEIALENPKTRQHAINHLIDLLSDFNARGLKVLLGVDFALGYPKDFPKALGLKDQSWKGVWAEIARRISDRPDNQNNRFEVAAQFNERMSGANGPFWGCPKSKQGQFLESRKPFANPMVTEKRLCEQRLSTAKSVWQLTGVGCVGSQTLMGIAHLHKLRFHPWFEDEIAVWPFETGLKSLDRATAPNILLAEIYPSQIKVKAEGDKPKDAVQVTTMAHHYAALDDQGLLGDLFAGDRDLTPDERFIIEQEEGWVLGVGRDPKAQARDWMANYIRLPNDIYKKSQQMIEQEIDVSMFDLDMQDVAVRMIHACGDIAVREQIAFSPNAADVGRKALQGGAAVLVDVEMVSHGIIRKRLPHHNPVVCTLNDPRTPGQAAELGTTRSAAAVEFWGDWLAGSVVVIGNAPTALFHLLQGIIEGRLAKPALIIGCPVGFVGAEESKECLIALQDDHGVPYITLRGRRGGSAIAASALNALAKEGITQ